MNNRIEALLRRAKELPRAPGVYLFKDARGSVLYVGKAARLRDRVSSYFLPSADLGPKKQGMLELVEDFDVVECESEWEALLAEARLIKDARPRFNSLLTDDKTFPYLVVTTREDFPAVFVTRELTDPRCRGAQVFGPFTSPGALREAVDLLQSVFRFRTCSLRILPGDPRNRRFRPCLLHSIGKCSAPCADRIDREAYRADVQRFLRFLTSRRSATLRSMREEMRTCAERLDFEQAAALRDQIRALEKLDERASRRDRWQPEIEGAILEPEKGLRALQKVLEVEAPIRCVEAIDIAHLQGGETVGAKVCFVDGRPLKSQYRRYRIRHAHNDDYAAIRETVSRRYREAGKGEELYPDVILIDGGLGQLHAALEAFASLAQQPPMVIALAKKEELLYVQRRSAPIRLARTNAALRLCQAIRDEAHRFAQHYHHVLRRKKTLGG